MTLSGVVMGRTVGGEEHPTNSALFAAQGNLSLHFTQYAALTFNAGIELYSDRYDFEGFDRDMLRADTDRQFAIRFRIGGTLDVVVSDRRWRHSLAREGR